MPSAETPSAWLLRSVEIDDEVLDCRLAGGRIRELGQGLVPRTGEGVLDGRGAALLPGLADHHLHVLALAAARGSIDLAGAADLQEAPDDAGAGWLRVIGAGRELVRGDVDGRWGGRPVRVQHRSGALWTLSSAAVEALAAGLSPLERESGQVWRDDSRLRVLLAEVDDGLPDRVRDVGRDLASWGITHLTDATPDLDEGGLDLVRSALPQHVLSMSGRGDGPRKIVLPDHGDHDYAGLCAAVIRWHAEGRPVAIHAVSAVTLAMTLAVLDEVGTLPGDRVEHAAVCDDDAARRLAELGVAVVTQPTVFARHGDDFVRDSPPYERGLLWRHAGLVALGVRVVVSSDAPYGDADPAATIRACAHRDREGVTPQEALRSFLLEPEHLGDGPRRVAVGADASVCLLTERLGSAVVRAGREGVLGVRETFVSGVRCQGS